eukprot:Skav202156  [mRNA]  locus=scaffold970:213497:215266:- [translate_table: standard]
MLSIVPVWNREPVQKAHVFVDGSSFQNRSVPTSHYAAWSFIVVVECNVHDRVEMKFHSATSHPLPGAADHHETFLGLGEVLDDALTAEATGMIWTVVWILQSVIALDYEVHFDNNTIGQFMAGTAHWQASWEYTQIKSVLGALRNCLRYSGRHVVFSHVKAHDGSPWNELADALAKASAKGIIRPAAIPVKTATALRHPSLKFVWMELAGSAHLPKPAALRATFLAEGPFHGNVEDISWSYPQPRSVQESVDVSFKVGTINVLTLDPGTKSQQSKGLFQVGRIAALQAHLVPLEFLFVGIQEARTQGAVTRHSVSHFVFQSGATAGGTHGCELWVARHQHYATHGPRKFYLAMEHFHVSAVDARYLLVTVRAPHLHLRILVVHAPHKSIPSVDVEEWWHHLSSVIARTSSGIPLIVLADSNSCLGSVVSNSVSNFCADDESVPGHAFHAFLMEHQLWAPATFSECHRGDSYTFIASDGSKHRLDFVCVPIEWQQFAVDSWISYDVDFATAKHDHFLAAVQVRMAHPRSSREITPKIRIDVRKCADDKLREQFTQYMQHPPCVPWHVGVGTHAEIFDSLASKRCSSFLLF